MFGYFWDTLYVLVCTYIPVYTCPEGKEPCSSYEFCFLTMATNYSAAIDAPTKDVMKLPEIP